MAQDSKFSLQLLEKIGAPLMAAINDVVGDAEKEDVEVAQIMAQLLSQSVQMSTSLYNTLEIKEDTDQTDSTRLALTALVAPLVGEFYRKRKEVPVEKNTQRMVKSFEALLGFAENFTPAADHKSRLQTVGQDAILFDKNQPILVTLQAMVPVINAIEEFSFGESRRKLAQKVCGNLQETAKDLAQKTGEADALHELIIFKALADIYASCHRNATQRAMADDNRDQLSLDPIWEAFGTKVAMMEAVLGVDTPMPETVATAESVKPDDSPAPGEAPPPATAPEPASAGTAGPMGFFKKPGANEAPPAAVEASAPVPPPVAAPATEQAPTDAPSSPMGFFKPGAKKEGSDNA